MTTSSSMPTSGAVGFGDDELARIREQLPAIHARTYLNAGTLGPIPAPAIAAMQEERDYDDGLRQTAELWERLGARQAAARSVAAELLGVAAEQVALMHSTHEGLNSCLWGMDLAAGDRVVTTDEEHPGLLVPLRNLRARVGIEVDVAPWRDGDAFVESVLSAVGPRTRVVAISHVSWSSGRIAPLRDLRAALPEHVRLVVDGAQSAGIVPTDLSDGWDAYTVSGQKWTCGPNGSGALALRDPAAWLPTFGAYMQVVDHEQILSSPVVDDGRRFEQSQEALIPLAGFAASVRWLLDEVGVARAAAHARVLNERCRVALDAGGVDAGLLHGHAHLLAVGTGARDANDVAQRLYDDGLLIRPLGTDRVRVSFGAWNTPAEVDAVAAALVRELS